MHADRVSKQDVKDRCQHMLCKDLYVIFTRRAPGITLAQMREVTPDHLAYQVQLERQGVMWAAGPMFTADDLSWEGDGMVIVRAESLVHAQEIASADPMHKRGVRQFDIRPWLLNEGSLTIQVSFSDGRQTIR